MFAKLAIVADGAKSSMCQQLGINIERYDYGHQAIIANIATDKAHQSIAYERFTETGPMALLPLPASEPGEYRSALIWTLAHKEAENMMLLSDDDFLKILQQRFGTHQGQFI